MSKLNVLMVNYEFPPIGGGAGNAHLSLLKEYAGKGDLRVDVLTSAPKPGVSTEQFAPNITIYRVGVHKKRLHHWRKVEVAEWLVKAGPHYRRRLKENRYDLAHAFFGFPTGWLCYRSARKLPYIISLRGSDVPGIHGRLKFDYKVLAPAFRAIWKKASRLVACSEGLRRRALAFLPSVAIDVIPNGVDSEIFHPVEKPEKSEALRLLTVGRLSVTKRVEQLIDAVAILDAAGCRVTLTIVGGGALEGRLRVYASEKTVRDTVRITGRVEPGKMAEIYRQHDVFVSATAQEGMSNAMLEATASGLPIVTTRCEGVEELIGDNGVVVEIARAGQIANAIKRLINNPSERRRMSAAARRRAAELTWAKAAARYVECYRRMLNSRSLDSEAETVGNNSLL